MDFRLSKLKLTLLVAATGAMVLSAGAQQSGQPIIFSPPQNDGVQSGTPSLAPQDPQFSTLPDAVQAPQPVFDFSGPSDVPAMPPPQEDAAERLRMKKILEGRKDWTQMTPAEMLGVAPNENPELSPGDDAAGQDKSQTTLGRYLDQEKQSQASLTNDWRNEHENSPWNLAHGQDDANPFGFRRDDAADPAQKRLNWDLNYQPGSNVSANQNGNESWDSFSTPVSQTPAPPDVEQQAAMERFRQLLEPSPTPAPGSLTDGKFSTVPNIAVDPNMMQPAFTPNPAGASFTPLSSGIGTPEGLTPLPGIVTPIAQPAVTPSWVPQPAPWLSQTPQPFTIPQRKF